MPCAVKKINDIFGLLLKVQSSEILSGVAQCSQGGCSCRYSKSSVNLSARGIISLPSLFHGLQFSSFLMQPHSYSCEITVLLHSI